MATLLATLGTSIANVALPELGRHFDSSFQEVQWVLLAYLIALTTVVVGVGRLGDVVGKRRLLLAGILLFTAASAASAAAPTLSLLVVARAAQGLGAAVMMTLAMALVGQTVARARTGRTLGLLGTTSAIGTAVGPSLGGILIHGLGWRAVFAVTVPLGIAALVLAWRTLPPDRAGDEGGRAGFDAAGTLVLGLTLGAYALAMTLGRGSFGAANLALLLAAAAGAGLFLLIEVKARSPLVRPAMFRDRSLGAGLALTGLVSTVVMATLVVGPFYLSGGLGLSSAGVGLALSTGPLVAATMGVPAGRLTDRFGAAPVTLAGLLAMAAGASLLALLPTSPGVGGYLAPVIVLTAGYALFQAANNTALMTGAAADRRGLVSGMLNLSRNLGLITGASAMGAVFALASAWSGAAGARAAADGMRVTFAVAALLLVVALAAGTAAGSFRRGGTDGEHRQRAT